MSLHWHSRGAEGGHTVAPLQFLRYLRSLLNPRPGGVFGRTRPEAPCLTQERVAVARWARQKTKAFDEYFLIIFLILKGHM